MSVELATAYVSIIPSTAGIKGQLQKGFGRPLEQVVADAGRKAGGGFVSNLASNAVSGLDRLGGTIVGTVTKGFKIGGAVAAAGFGASLMAGFNRLRAIDDARFKLQGLGHDADAVDKIMESALGSVKGTSFGLGDAASIAASAVAAGIKPGQELLRTLSLTGDAATIAGVPLNEMGSIFNKVAAGNRMMTQEMNQLTDRGVPILQWLAAEFGVTALAARDMVSDGEVDFATFQKVIEDNIGGAALTAGESFRGSLANAGAAIGRFGAAILGPAFEAAPAFFQRIITAVDAATERVGPFVEQWADAFTRQLVPAIESLSAWFTGTLVPAMQTVGEWFNRNRDGIVRVAMAVGPAVAIIGTLATSIHLMRRALVLLGMSTPVGLLMALAAAITFAWQNSETFRNIVTGAFEAVQRVVGPIVERVVGFVQNLADRFSGGGGLSGAMETFRGIFDRVAGVFREGGAVFEWVTELVADLRPRFSAIGDSFQGIWQTVQPVVQWIGERLPGAFQTLWKIAQPIIRFLVGLIGDTLKLAIDGIVQAFQGAVSIVEGVLNIFAGLFTGDWSRLWEGVKQVFSGVWNAIVGIVKTYLAGTVLKLIAAPLKLIANLWRGAWNGIRSFFQGIWTRLVGIVRGGGNQAVGVVRGAWNLVTSIIRGAMNVVRTIVQTYFRIVQTVIRTALTVVRTVVSNVFGFVRSFITSAVNTARSVVGTAFSAIRSGIVTPIQAARAVVSSVFSAIRTLITTAATGARTAVVNAFQALLTGVRTRITNLLNLVRGIPDRIRSALGNLSNLLKDAGKAIIRGLIAGITAMAGKVGEAIGGVLGAARRLLPSSPAKEGPFSGKGWTLYSGRAISEALADGITDRTRLVAAATSQLASAAQAEVAPVLSGMARPSRMVVRPAVPEAPSLSARETDQLLRRMARGIEDLRGDVHTLDRDVVDAVRDLVR